MKILTSLAFTLAAFLAPIQGLLITMAAFILADTIMGIYVAVKQGGWAAYESDKLFNIVVKSAFYLISIILAFVVDTYIVAGTIFGISLFLSKTMAVTWIYVEVKSIDENSQKLGNRSIWVIFKEIIKKLKSLKSDLKDITDK